jgi:glutamate formiminotransferase
MIECVPNFSEGCNLAVVREIRDAIASVDGVLVLGCESDEDHNRSVITIAGPGDAVCEGVIRGAVKASFCIDLTRHRGVHPRIGATDVIPFVPLAGSTMEECIALARRAAAELWRRAQVPSYFYEFAGARRLEEVRKGGFPPDIGGPDPHPAAGATAIGARRILIACNVNLASRDLDLAKRIARKIRASSGGFPHVKALGFELASRELVQVSMNLTHHEVTPLHVVYDAIRLLALDAGADIAETELIGFIPEAAAAQSSEFLAKCRDFDSSRILEVRIAQLTPGFAP